MKKIKMFFIGLLIISLIPITTIVTQSQIADAGAETMTTNKTINVNGEGVIKVKPDTAYLSIGVETSNKNVETAQKDNKDKMNKLLASLNQLGIKNDDIKTTNYSIYPDYKYNNQTGESTLNGYKVVNMIDVTVSKIDTVGTVIDNVTKNGANNINQISFGIANQKEVYLKALNEAVKDSKTKAETIANALSVRNITLVNVTEVSSQNSVYPIFMETASVSKDSATPINSGDITIKASVTASYTY